MIIFLLFIHWHNSNNLGEILTMHWSAVAVNRVIYFNEITIYWAISSIFTLLSADSSFKHFLLFIKKIVTKIYQINTL